MISSQKMMIMNTLNQAMTGEERTTIEVEQFAINDYTDVYTI